MAHGRRLITPITRSIYDTKAPREFCPLDERLLWWLYESDTWRSSPKEHSRLDDSRREEWRKKLNIQKSREIWDRAKDMAGLATSFFATKHARKNDHRAHFNQSRNPLRGNPGIRPDKQAMTSPRVFARSHQNAKRFFGGQ